MGADGRPEIHLREHIALQVNSGCDFDQLQRTVRAVTDQAKDAALGHVQHALPPLARFTTAEGTVLHRLDELARPALAQHLQISTIDPDLEIVCCEGASKDDHLGVLTDVDKAAGAGQSLAKPADIQITLCVGLGQAKDSNIESTAVIKIKLIGLIKHRLGVDSGAKTHAAGRDTADDTRLGRQGQQINQFFLCCHGGHTFRHADAKVDHGVGSQLHGRTPGNHLALGQRRHCQGFQRHPNLPRISWVVLLGKGLHVVRWIAGDDHRIHQYPRHPHLARVQCAALCHALDLRDDDAARVVRRHGDGQRFERQGLALHRQIAIRIGGRSADDAYRNRKRLVEEVVLAVDLHQPDQFLGGARVDLAATKARINKSIEPNMSQGAGLASGNITKQMRDHALGQVVGFNLVVDRELLQRRYQPPVPSHNALDHATVAKMIEPARLAIALAGRIHQRQLTRRAHAAVLLTGQKTLFQRDRNAFGKADPDKATGGYGVAIVNKADRFRGRHDLVAAGTGSNMFIEIEIGMHRHSWVLALSYPTLSAKRPRRRPRPRR